MAGPRETTARRGPPTGLGDGHVPALPRAYVPRSRLWERLDGATGAAVTVLVGPGGSGKTLGVAGWLRERRLAAGTRWVAGDPSWTPDRLDALLAHRDPEGRPGLVVVDDAHRLPLATIRRIDDLLDRAPGSLRLLLATRWDLPLTRLASELLGQLTTLRGDLLRLDDVESAAVVAAHARTGSPEVASAIASRSQGWCAAVVLAARTVGAAPDPVAAARQYALGRSVADRVASEVFATLRPRERHLLLCVANEPLVTPSLAEHLTRDTGAGDVLDELELTGLLVTRVTTPDDGETEDAEPGYAIHPLLAEIVRRRIASGGVDVMRASSTVHRAVLVDVARGETEHALRRLVALGDLRAAAALLAEEGPALLLRGHGELPRALTASERSALEDDPDTWFALALDRWFVGDASHALHWLDRLVATPEGDCPTARLEVACARVMRARLGIEPLPEAIEEAEAAYTASPPNAHAVLPILLWELGSAHAWTGDLDRAAALHLIAARLARSLGLPRLEAPVLSSLALVEYARGHLLASTEVGAEAAAILTTQDLDLPYTEARVVLVRGLCAANEVPTQPRRWVDAPLTSLHEADLFTAFWARLLRARIALATGSLLAAERILEEPLPVPLPGHLVLAGAVERALMATLSRDGGTLLASAETLDADGWTADAAFVAALRADVVGDPRRAITLLDEAGREGRCLQPHTRAHALVLLAQLLDSVGDGRAAHAALADALVLTEVRRDVVPFLDWSWHGTRVLPLLERHLEAQPSEWGTELLAMVREVPGIVTTYGPHAVEDEQPLAARAPLLSPRERDVLLELARGSTYADIAASLFVSENTVKTHVSSLYAKLAVNRRSAALAAARSLRLL